MLSALLVQAAEARSVLRFVYDDKPRDVEIHAVGNTAKGELIIRGWQTNADPPAWKLFKAEKIFDLTVDFSVVNEAPRPGYKAGDKAMAEILFQLPEPARLAEAA